MRIKLFLYTNPLLLALIIFAWPALIGAAPPPPSTPVFVSGEILIKMKPHRSMVAAQQLLQTKTLRLMDVSPRSQLMRVAVPPGQEAVQIAAFAARSDVEFVGYNYLIYALDAPNDPDFGQQWSLHNTGPIASGFLPDADIDAPEAWNIFTGNGNTVIAIVDTGVDYTHPDLAANIWTNPNEIAGNSLDDDNNGFVDDIRGYDFYNNDNDPYDDHSHGTHAAGIAAAVGNNGIGISGVNWNAQIMPVKILSGSGTGSIYELEKGLYYAADNGANIINMSLGGTCGTSWNIVQDAIDYAVNKKILLVAAAGNYSHLYDYIFCPAAMDGVMAVAATTTLDLRASYSQYGPQMDIGAPGGNGSPAANNIYSTLPGGGYGTKYGTSMAAPHVAGLAALLWDYTPTLYHTDVESIIEATADDIAPAGWDQYTGAGRINAHTAMQSLNSLQISPPQLAFIFDDISPISSTQTIQLTSQDSANVTWSAVISPSVPWLSLPATTAGAIVNSASPVELTMTATRPAGYGVFSTTVIITGFNAGGQSVGSRTSLVRITNTEKLERLYLPLMLKNVAHLPDILIESLVAASDGVTVTLKNEGMTASENAFWVDVYFNPNQAPQLNQPWDTIAPYGAVWGITESIPVGSYITLTRDSAYFFPSLSSSMPLPADAIVYGLADSINFDTNYGAIRENNEENNLYGPVVSIAGDASQTIMMMTAPSQSNLLLPARQSARHRN
jgi:subtilisin family serine protease